MKITEIAFTGYPVTDMQRSRDFYEKTLGLSVSRKWGQDDDPQWVEYDIGSGCLALITGAGDKWPPANAGPAVALEVDDFDGFMTKLRTAGTKFLWEPQDSPMCRMAIILDPDENRLALHHRKPTTTSKQSS
ncbi:MAG TPA: VOC family protein [Opitutaceae bacterium]|nr:VOC family protein [Opitutaceae bacterium]